VSKYDQNYRNRIKQQLDAKEAELRKARATFSNPRREGKSWVEEMMRRHAEEFRKETEEALADAIRYGKSTFTANTQKDYSDKITLRTMRDGIDRMNGVYRPSPIADEAEKGLVLEGTSRRK
jgi:hypothetical protein